VTESADSSEYVFLSCVPADNAAADLLQEALEAAGARVWRAATEVRPGDDWRALARAAISEGTFAFLACFSRARLALGQSGQHEELVWAIDELRQHSPGDSWLIPVRFDDCEIPAIDLGAGRTLRSLRPADLFGSMQAAELARLVTAVTRRLGSGQVLTAPRSVAAVTPAEPVGRAKPRRGRLLKWTGGRKVRNTVKGSVIMGNLIQADRADLTLDSRRPPPGEAGQR
jgi:TIR domain